MSRKRKKQLTYMMIGLLFLFTGVEYAVILPTLYQYLRTLGATSMYLGLTLSAFSISGLFSGPIIGRLSDRNHSTKYLLIVANLFEIGGNILYFIGISPAYILLSRFIAGMGSGVGAAVTADIARSTSAHERTSVLSLVMLCRQFGLILGPSCNLFLMLCDFKLGPFSVTALSAPGIFMAVLWILFELAVPFCYHDLAKLAEEEEIERHIVYNSTTSCAVERTSENAPEMTPQSPEMASLSQAALDYGTFDDRNTPVLNELKVVQCQRVQALDDDPDSMMESAERFMTLPPGDDVINDDVRERATSRNGVRRPQRVDDDVIVRDSGDWSQRRSYYVNEYLREEVVVVLYSAFAALVNQTGLEAMLTPLTLLYLDWGELENSYLFLGAGIELILMFIVVSVASKRVSDVTLITLGYVMIVVSTAVLMYGLPRAPLGDQSNLAMFLFCVILNVAGLPFVFVCTVSLFSKVTSPESQGLSQGLRRTFMGIGTILGPLWTGSMLYDLHWMIGVLLAVMALALLLVLLSFNYLRRLDNNQRNTETATTES